MTLFLNNQTARRLWLQTNGLLSPVKGPLDLLSLIKQLGFVQLDTIQNVSRAHHHILWSRHASYREEMLDELLKTREDIFEHFTHDASVLPMAFYPMWRRQFGRFAKRYETSSYYDMDLINQWTDHVMMRLIEEGPLSTKSFESKKKDAKKAWSRPPHKQALEYLWYTGKLSTSHREKFHKFYDLSERVIPKRHYNEELSDASQIEWLCQAALERLGIATAKEIKEFWDAMEISDAEAWIRHNEENLMVVEWETASGEVKTSYAFKDIEQRIANLPKPQTSMRILNPFDPAIRNRDRLKELFGFDYKLEVFVPAAKRKWGYYVYPLLEGDRFVGRLDAKADRKARRLNILNLWSEAEIKWGAGREKRLAAELNRFLKLADLDYISEVRG